MDKVDWLGFGFFAVWLIVFGVLWFELAAFVCLLVFSHEFGHYLLAKKYGLYRGIKFTGGIAAVELSEPFPSRWGYLSGFAGSLPVFPVFVWLFPSYPFWLFFVVALALSVLDLVVVFGYSKVVT